ncbi:type II toxin-antitoxin system ParD family antitoxin [Halomonas sp. PR-M31]
MTLGQHFDTFIAEQLKSGRYSSTSFLQDRMTEIRRTHMSW